LRALAVMLVIAFHAQVADMPAGFVGVDLFFVLSGFLVCQVLLGDGDGSDRPRLRNFYARRTRRLLSITALVMLAMAAPAAAPTAMQWLANVTMVAPAFGQSFMDGAYWSIVLEIVFYGWVAVLLALGVYQRRLLTIIAIWLAISFANEAVLHWRPLRLLLVTEYAAMFASGMLIYRIRAGDRSLFAFGLLGFAVALGALHAFESQRAIARIYSDDVNLSVLWFLHAWIYALFFSALWLSRRIAVSRWVLVLGGVTYPLYLVHQNVGHLAIDALEPLVGRWSAFSLAVLAVLALALLVHRYAEPAGHRLLDRALRPLMGPARGRNAVT